MIAPFVHSGAINRDAFETYVERFLVLELRPGDIVVMDNLASHKNKAMRRAIRVRGATLLFLPKYSPDLNPNEQVFAKLKHRLRNAAERTRDTLCRAIAEILDTISTTECANDLVNSGCART